jgi:hypothetical protein
MWQEMEKKMSTVNKDDKCDSANRESKLRTVLIGVLAQLLPPRYSQIIGIQRGFNSHHVLLCDSL